MKIKFWGTRGSLPQATTNTDFIGILGELIQTASAMGIRTTRTLKAAVESGELGQPVVFGGNTTCTEVIHNEEFCFVDMGSGLREAGTFYMQKGVKEFHIFLTHMHWDHIMGLPFFIPVHVPGCVVKIYHVHRNAPEHVRINFNGINFPLTFEQLGGKIEFEQLKLYETKELNGIKVTPFSLDHPGGCFGYRFEAGGKSAVIGVDSEFKRISQAEMGKDLPFYQNLDLLVFDAQYEITELANRFDWGHSSPTIGVDLALREGIRQMALTHHDPWSTGPKLRRMLAAAEKHLKRQIVDHTAIWDKLGQPAGTKLFNAYDGLVVDLA